MAWVPLFLLWFGIGESSKIALIALGVFFPVYLNLMNGVRSADRKLVSIFMFAFAPFSNGEDQKTTKARGVFIHIGYQKFNTLNILKAKGTLDRRLAFLATKAEWHQFAAGPQLLEALNAGSLDFGRAADAPTAFGQDSRKLHNFLKPNNATRS
jgi:hypothetical protein